MLNIALPKGRLGDQVYELIRDVEIKYPQKKKVTSTAEFEIVDDEDFEDESPKKKTNVKTNRS